MLITGPPATGKSHLLAEIKRWFTHRPSGVTFSPTGPNVFPPGGGRVIEWLPSPDRADRRVWSMTFHQGTKYRDFVRGIVPGIGADAPAFMVTTGTLLEAAFHALSPTGASLVAIDEINRGPAVAVFGDLITAIEADKRLLATGERGPETVSVRLLDEKGAPLDFALPHHLYLVAAMNEADTSVEPLDVAFRRRFQPLILSPNETLLRSYFGLGAPLTTLPVEPDAPSTIYEAAVQAWRRANTLIELARGAPFQIGHGVFMAASQPPTSHMEALSYVAQIWALVDQHIREVFFGDVRGTATALAAGQPGSPYELREEFFAEAPVARLVGPGALGPDNVYPAIRAIATAGL